MQLFQRLLIICLCIFLPIAGMSLPPPKTFNIKIDSISQKDIGRHIIPSLKHDSAFISIKNIRYPFRTTQAYSSSLKTILSDSVTINLSIRKLVAITPDSLYISALNQLQYGALKSVYLDTVAINKNDLNGISLVFPPSVRKLKSLYAGYSANLRDKENEAEINHKNYHTIELGASYTKSFPSFWGYTLYAGNEFVLNSEKFFIGPKVGASVHMLLFMAGNEIICYSNLNRTMLAYKPYIGIGLGPFKISAGYNLFLFNNDYFNMNHASFTLTIPFMFKE